MSWRNRTSRRPGVTVAIPSIPPRRALLQRALGSVVAQTFSAAAVSVAVDLSKEGAAITRQRALDGVQTTWTAFLDDDDEFEREHLEKLWNHAQDTGADYVFSWYHVVAGGQVLQHDPVFPPTHFSEPWDPARPRQTTITVLVKTELAKEVGFVPVVEGQYVDGQRYGEDYEWTLGCNRLGKISHLVDHTWLWHHDSGNTSGRPDRWS
jgi:glycosyltransferase involved in cell wall biosynthesis